LVSWEARFVGRDNEFRLLLDGIEQARKGHGNILFITGEAGVGKTRLAYELLNQKDELNFEFLCGQCIYREGVDPYLPFIDMFKGYLAEHPYLAQAIQASFKSQDGVIFDFYQIDKQRYSPNNSKINRYRITTEESKEKNNKKEMDGSELKETTFEFHDEQLLEGKHRMFETISRLINGIAKKQPLLIFIDDVHWADEASLHLLHYLARNIQNQPILILCAYRTEELDITRGKLDPLQEFISRLGSENLFSTVDLQRLDFKQTEIIVSDLLGVTDIPMEFAELIHKETEGNPFFIKEVLKTLIEDDALIIEDDNLKLRISPEEIVIPVSIRELINLRIQRLDDESLDVIEHAAIIGNEFNFEFLNNVMDISDSKLINVLTRLIDTKIIDELKDEKGFKWNFTHNKIHEVVYNNLNENKKRLIHLRLAKYLEDTKIDNIEEVVYDLAYHFYMGLDFDRALSYSIEGGEKAMKSYANNEALKLFTISLDSLRLLDEKLANTTHYKEKKIEVLSRLGTLHRTIGEWEKALNYFEQIIPVCDEISDHYTKLKIYLEIGWVFERRNYYKEAKKYFEKSLDLAKNLNDDFIFAEVYQGLGTVHEREGDFGNALEYFTTSQNYAKENEDVVNIAKVHNAFGRIFNMQGDFEKAVDHKQKSISIFKKLNYLPELAKAYASLAVTYNDMDDVDKNIEINNKCIELADKISDLRIKGYGLSNSVNALLKTNKLKKALNYATSAHDIFRKLDDLEMVALSYMNFGLIFKQKEEWEVAIDNFKSAIELMEQLDIPYHLAECYKQFFDIYSTWGKTKKAKYYMNKANQIYNSMGISGENKFIGRVQEQIF
jgi:predicted ATPase